jgi:hypothetical protein
VTRAEGRARMRSLGKESVCAAARVRARLTA